jgi:hypothetical protein
MQSAEPSESVSVDIERCPSSMSTTDTDSLGSCSPVVRMRVEGLGLRVEGLGFRVEG